MAEQTAAEFVESLVPDWEPLACMEPLTDYRLRVPDEVVAELSEPSWERPS